MCLENERTRGEPIYRGWEPPEASRGMSTGNVHPDEGVLDIQVRCVFATVSSRNLIIVASRLLSFTRHEDRPDFKKVEGSMKSYYSSIANKSE